MRSQLNFLILKILKINGEQGAGSKEQGAKSKKQEPWRSEHKPAPFNHLLGKKHILLFTWHLIENIYKIYKQKKYKNENKIIFSDSKYSTCHQRKSTNVCYG